MERSKIKTSFSTSLNDGWETNFIENEDGTKIIEVGVNGFYPMCIHFGGEKGNRFVYVFNTLRPDEKVTVAEWESFIESCES